MTPTATAPRRARPELRPLIARAGLDALAPRRQVALLIGAERVDAHSQALQLQRRHVPIDLLGDRNHDRVEAAGTFDDVLDRERLIRETRTNGADASLDGQLWTLDSGYAGARPDLRVVRGL